MPKQIGLIAKNHMRNPLELTLTSTQTTPETLSHQFLYCPNPKRRPEELLILLQKIEPKQCLIFVNSRREVEELYRTFRSQLDYVDFLHGGLEQSVRTIVTNKFMKGKIRYLIATDIAARGLDFSNVTHVFNYHFPFETETYLHRAGRTGRSGRIGTCVTLVTARDMSAIQQLFKMLHKEPEWLREPPAHGAPREERSPRHTRYRRDPR
jgi:ATP-dependent RNA helicase DeaD